MPAPKPISAGETLRRAADRIYLLAERVDTPPSSLSAREQLHHDIETAAGDVRAVVRGRGFR